MGETKIEPDAKTASHPYLGERSKERAARIAAGIATGSGLGGRRRRGLGGRRLRGRRGAGRLGRATLRVPAEVVGSECTRMLNSFFLNCSLFDLGPVVWQSLT